MLVVLHGWSDSSSSFTPLVKKIRTLDLPSPIVPIYLGDYVSMDDDVTFVDIVRAMDRAWDEASLPRNRRSVDMVVHSTGALVVRHWMTSYFTPETNPLRRLVMLAPANFGSHLAHKGNSFLGRVAKGYKSKRLFHTGKRILHGLELASSFSTQLACVDRFDQHKRWYGEDRILATTLVGTHGYTGIAAAANEVGSDGTVLVSTANLNPVRLEVDFSSDPKKPAAKLSKPNGRTAFCRMPNENHSTIACKDRGPANRYTMELIRQSLIVSDSGFDKHCNDLDSYSEQNRIVQASEPYTQGYQNTVLHVLDDQGSDIPDYFIEFFTKQEGSNSEDKAATEFIQRHVLTSVHTNRQNAALRALKFNCNQLSELFAQTKRSMHMSITASPEISDTGSVGYSTIAYDDIGSLPVNQTDAESMFVPDRTLLVQLTLRRNQIQNLVRFTAAKG